MGTFQPIGADLFSLGPALAVWGAADEHLFAFAVGMDQALWYAQLDGDYFAGDPLPVWSAWRSLGGVVTSSPCAVRTQPDSSVDVFALGIASELLHWSFRDGSWVDHPQEIETAALSVGLARVAAGAFNGAGGLMRQYWESLGGVLTSPAHAVKLNQGVFAFARGTDQALWSRSFVSGSWSDWISLGRILASCPHAVFNRDGLLAVFALGTDSAIWCAMTPSGNPSDLAGKWQSLGGTFSSRPFAVAWGAEIFLFASDPQSALSYNRWDGFHWTGWYSLGGILMSPPVASADPWGVFPPHVYALGTDSGAYRRTYSWHREPNKPPDPLTPWLNWESIASAPGEVFLSLPAATVRTRPSPPFGGVRDLLALGTDHRVWHQEYFRPFGGSVRVGR